MLSFHKSSLFFVALMCVWWLENNIKYRKAQYILMFVGLVGYQILASTLLPFLTSDSSIGIAVERATTDTTVELDSLSVIDFAIIFLTGFICFKETLRDDIDGCYRHALNIVFILMIFILINLRQAELARRFYYYLMPFITLAWMVFWNRQSSKQSAVQAIVSVLMIFVFGVYTIVSMWNYQIPDTIFLTPVFFYHFQF